MKDSRSSLSLRVIVLLASCATTAAGAETVHVRSGFGSSGQGWLFGSPLDGRCQLLLPAHVLIRRDGGPMVKEGSWRSADGSEGRLLRPWSGAPEDPDLDIAFADVDGIEPDRCLSRLGIANATRLLGRSTRASVQRRHERYADQLAFRLDSFDERYVRSVPDDPAAERAVGRGEGLSGTLLTVPDGARDPKPIGMIVRVDKEERVAIATRLDLVRRRFLAGRPDDTDRTSDDGPGTAAFDLLRVEGLSADPGRGPDRLNRSGCWSVAPNANQRRVVIELSATRPGTIGKVTMTFDPECGGEPDAVQLLRASGSRWRTVADCPVVDARAACTVRTVAGERLRLVLVVRGATTLGISRLELTADRD